MFKTRPGLAFVGIALLTPIALGGELLPPGALARLGSTQFRHGSKIAAIAFSPDGTLLASASGEDGGRDDSVRLWAVATGEERLRFGSGTLRCYCLAFSPDGKLLAAGAVDGTVRLWEVATGREVRRFAQQQGWVLSVAFSPDGKLLAAGSLRDPDVRVWDVGSGTERQRLGGHEGEVTAVTFSPDGQALATGGPSMDARLWEAATGKELRRFGGLHVPKARALAFSPDGALLVTAEGDMLLYDVATGRPRGRLGGKQTDLAGYSVAFAPDGKTLAAADWSGNVRIWDVPGERESHRFEVPRGIGPCLAYSPDGKRLAWAGYGNTIRLWNPATGKELTGAGGAQGPVRFVAFGLNGAAAITGSWHDDRVRIWDLGAGAEGVAPRGRHGAALPVHGQTFAVSPDGRMLAIGDSGSKLRLVDIASGEEVNPFPLPPTAGAAMAFTPDGKGLVVLSTNYTLSLRDLIRWQEVRRFVGHNSPVDAIAISPDGTRMASSGTPRAMIRRPPPGFQEDTATRLWDLTTGKELRQLPGRYATLAFSADGATLAAGAYALFEPIQLLDVATGKVTRRIDCPRHGPYRVVFSPDGKSLASAGRDGTVRLWEVATGGERRRFVGHTGDVYSVAFSSDGRRLLSGGADTTAILWNAVSPDPGREAALRELATGGALEAADAVTAYRAICALLAEPTRAVRLLDRTARAAQPADPQRLAQWIADLNSERFAVRQQASAELASLAELAQPALQQYLDRKPSLEGRRRAERLLEPLRAGTAPEQLRRLRTVEILESIGSADARRVLERLAAGAPAAGLTREAKAALARLALRAVKRWSPPAPEHPAGIDDLLRGPTKTGAGRAGDRLPAGAVTRLGKQVTRPGESGPDFFVLAADARSAAVLDGTPVIRVVDLPSGRVLHSVTTGLPKGWVNRAFLSPDGTRLAAETSGGQDPSPSLYLWDVAADKKVWQVDSRAMLIDALWFSPSGKVLATGGRDHVLRLWDAATGKEVRSWPDPNDRTLCFAFSLDGKVLASGGWGNLVRLWDADTGRLIRQFGGVQDRGDGVMALAFSPTATVLGSGENGRVRIWDWKTGRQLLVLDEHLRGGVWPVAVSADGRSLLTGGRDGQVRLWELSTGRERKHFTGHTDDRSVTGALTPDGRSAVSAGVDGALFVWDLTGQAPDGQLARVTLSQAERAGLWRLLAGDDAHTAYRAGWKLAAGGDDTVAFLRHFLRPVPRAIGPHLDRLLADLRSDREPGRQAAMAELDRLGPLAASALRKGLSAQPVGETRDRIEFLLAKADGVFPSGEHLRLLRAIEVLERIGSPAARSVLAELAGGLPEARLTQEADQSLRRLERGPTSSP